MVKKFEGILIREIEHRGQQITITQTLEGKVISLIENEEIWYDWLASKRHSQIMCERMMDALKG